jgi:hypothetical protein
LGSTTKDTLSITFSSVLYSKETFLNSTLPSILPGYLGPLGECILSSSSKSKNIRSDEAIADCNILYLSEKSNIGLKSIWI